MSIEQQQELKPEKRTTKQGRKSIPFTDLSIKNWRPKKKADSVLNNYHGRPKYGGMIRGHSQSWYDLPYELKFYSVLPFANLDIKVSHL